MNQRERRKFLLNYLKKENRIYDEIEIPDDEEEERILLRSLMNVRPAAPVDDTFLNIQNDYLTDEIKSRGITDAYMLEELEKGIALWKGDITTLRADAIVNAANSSLTGCYKQNHRCIDNCIHTFAGIQLRSYCFNLIKMQGHEEQEGGAKLTPAFNLPSRYIIHTVGPRVRGVLTEEHKQILESCYRSCLELADNQNLKCLAFCCIGTGEFMFPNRVAAEIAVKTVRKYLKRSNTHLKVVFNVYKDEDLIIYEDILKKS